MANPILINTPFAKNGQRNAISDSDAPNPNNPTWQDGWDVITSTPISQGGQPPKREDFNGVLYAITDNIVHQSKGLGYEFDSAFATKIGGYPLNARIMLANGDIVRSTVDGNTTDPNVDMAGWVNTNKKDKSLNLDDFKTSANTDADAFYAMLAYAKAKGIKSLNITRDISVNRQITCNLSDVVIDFHGNKSKYIGSGQDNLRFNSFSFSGELTTTKTTLTTSSAMRASHVTVTNASIFKVGDVVLLKSTSVVAPLIYINHLCQIIGISANTIELDTVFGMDIDTSATVELIKVNPIRNTFVRNVSGFTDVQTSRANGSNFIGFDLAVNCHALNTNTKGFYFKGVHFYRSNSCSYIQGIARDAPAAGGGEGYAMQFDFTVNSLVKGIKAYSMRHLFDATASWNIDVQDCFDYASPSASFGCHKAFEYDIRFNNCHSILSKGNAFMFGSSLDAFGQTVNKISMRDCGVFGSALSAVIFATLGKGLEVSNTTLNIAGALGQFALICAENDTVISNVTTNAGISIVKPSSGAYTGGKVTISNNSKIYRNAFTRAIVMDLSTKLTVNNSFISGAVNMKTGSTLNLNNSDWDIDSILFIEAGDKTQFLNINGGSIKSSFATATTLALNVSKAVFNRVEFSFANAASKIANTCNDIEINGCSGVLSVETTATVNSIKLTNNPLTNNGILPVLGFTGSGITIGSLNVTGNTGAISASNYLMLLNNSGIVATKSIVMSNNTTGRITLADQSSTKCIATNNICASPVFPTADGSNKFVSNNITA